MSKPCWCECCWGCCYCCNKCCIRGGCWKGCGVVAIIIAVCTIYIWGPLILMAALLAIMLLLVSGCCGCFCCCKMFKGWFWRDFVRHWCCCCIKNPNNSSSFCGCFCDEDGGCCCGGEEEDLESGSSHGDIANPSFSTDHSVMIAQFKQAFSERDVKDDLVTAFLESADWNVVKAIENFQHTFGNG